METAKHNPKLFVKMFQPRFAEAVKSGAKTQTIRPVPKRIPKPGDWLSLRRWSGKPYHSKQEILGQAIVSSVHDITIGGGSGLEIDCGLIVYEFNDFAKSDGFSDFKVMLQWFHDQHELPFRGILIKWDLLPKLNP